MNPLESLMVVGAALALALPVPARAFDGSRGEAASSSQQSASPPPPPTVAGRPVDQSGAASEKSKGLLGVTEEKMLSGGDQSPALKDIAQRFADYVTDANRAHPYIKPDFRQKYPQQVALLNTAIAQAAKSAAKTDPASLAAVYAMIGPGSGGLPSWAKEDIFQALLAPDKDAPWRGYFEAGMSCWTTDGHSGAKCGGDGPYPEKPTLSEGYAQHWAQAITKAAFDAASEAINDARKKGQIKEDIEARKVPLAIDKTGVASSDGVDVPLAKAFSFTDRERYELGAYVGTLRCGTGCGDGQPERRISIREAWVRNEKGQLAEKVRVCDITAWACASYPVMKDGQYQQGSNFVNLAGVMYQVNFRRRNGDTQMSIYPATNQSGPESLMVTSLNQLQKRLMDAVHTDGHRVTLPPGCAAAVCREYLALGQGGQFGSVMLFPAMKLPNGGFQHVGDVPAFETDLTKVSKFDGREVPIGPPNTAIGCVGRSGWQADTCNRNGPDFPKSFYFIEPSHDGKTFSVKSCAEEIASKEWEGIKSEADCHFPPDPKPAAKPDQTAQNDQPPSSAPPTPTPTPKPTPKTEAPESLVYCSTNTSIPGMTRVTLEETSQKWTLFMASPAQGYLCFNGTSDGTADLLQLDGPPIMIKDETAQKDGDLIIETSVFEKGDNASSLQISDLGQGTQLDPSLYRSGEVKDGQAQIAGITAHSVFYLPKAHLDPAYVLKVDPTNKNIDAKKESDFYFTVGGIAKETLAKNAPDDARTVTLRFRSGEKAEEVIGHLETALSLDQASKRQLFKNEDEMKALEAFIKAVVSNANQDGDILVSLSGDVGTGAGCPSKGGDFHAAEVSPATLGDPLHGADLTYRCGDKYKGNRLWTEAQIRAGVASASRQ